jgi:molybdenum cofactor biosynthesis enzyme MoaA
LKRDKHHLLHGSGCDVPDSFVCLVHAAPAHIQGDCKQQLQNGSVAEVQVYVQPCSNPAETCGNCNLTRISHLSSALACVLQEAFAKAYQWQQQQEQQQEQPDQQGEKVSNNSPVTDHTAAAKSGSSMEQDEATAPPTEQQGTAHEQL